MYFTLQETIQEISNFENISSERKTVLQPFVQFIQQKKDLGLPILLNFVCTHNSRRSHLGQIWAQSLAHFHKIQNLFAYSGGTETTALYPKILEVLENQGFKTSCISASENPIYTIKFAQNSPPIIGFSKVFSHPFNPKSDFAAIMTCTQADLDCPNVKGAEKKISIPYEDPKISDNTAFQNEIYTRKSIEIATEINFVFSSIK